jgi:exopolysaccharide biosynthesis polyprenyl glycosylphosphotransferase
MESHVERRERSLLSSLGQATRLPAGQVFQELRQPFQLSLPVSQRRLVLIALDLLAVNAALVVGLWLSSGQSLSWSLLLQHTWRFVLASALWMPLGFTFDVYTLGVASRFTTSARAVLQAGFAAWAITSVFLYPAFGTGLSLAASATYLGSTLVLLLAARGLFVLVLVRPMFNRRTLIIGAGRAGREIALAIMEHENGAHKVVGFVDDDHRKLDHIIATHKNGSSASVLRVLGPRGTLPELISRHRITTLVLAVTDRIDGTLLQTLMDCLESGVEIVPMPLLYEQLTGRVPIEHVGENWYVAMPIDHSGIRSTRQVVNRVFDVVSAGVGMIFLLAALPVIAAAIYLDCPGPIFYKQRRVGKGGRTFWVYKFRSMVPDAENGKALWAKKDDPRITRVGAILRKTHVDEFPQFINILKGQMSAVGPRPERPEFVEELAASIPFYRVRHAVKPGMAGWGLVKQGYGDSEEDALLKLQYDLYYIKHQSLWLDIVILLKTVVDTIGLRGR